MLVRTDCHVHLDSIGPPHNVAAPTAAALARYARRESIRLVCGIYEQEESLRKFARLGIRIIPFYWERAPLAPAIPASAQGLKLHPYLDHYVLEPQSVFPALQVARERKLPVLVHTEDRMPAVSRGRLVAALAREFPDLTFIAAHSGSYAPAQPRPGEENWVPEERIRELVTEAIEAARACPNLFLEVSILASSVKAKLLVERAPLEKVLLGSDFPIDAPAFGSLVFQEDALRRAGLSSREIRALHENAFRLFQPRRS